VLVNLAREPLGAPMRPAAINELFGSMEGLDQVDHCDAVFGVRCSVHDGGVTSTASREVLVARLLQVVSSM
jgi:hypothetical protein